MDKERYSYFYGGGWFDVELPTCDGEGVIITNVSALDFRDESKRELQLQHRDKPGEAKRGKLEIPSGRWQAGEQPVEALRREVREESGLELTSVSDGASEYGTTPALYIATHPLFVASGFDGGYPALLVVYECIACGDEPSAQTRETRDPGWYDIKDVKHMLLANPDDFTPPAFAVLSEYFSVARIEETD